MIYPLKVRIGKKDVDPENYMFYYIILLNDIKI